MSNIDDQNDARRTVEAVAHRERRRIRILAGVTIALWVAAFFVLPALYMPLCAKVKQHVVDMTNRPPNAAPLTAQEIAEKIGPLSEMAMLVGGLMMGLALLTEILAAVSTVMLALTIRRVTLRQVSASLAEISDQLRLLRQERAP